MVDTHDLSLLAELCQKEDGRTAFPTPYFQRAGGFRLNEREQSLPRIDVETEPILGGCKDELLIKRDGLIIEMSADARIVLKRVGRLTMMQKCDSAYAGLRRRQV